MKAKNRNVRGRRKKLIFILSSFLVLVLLLTLGYFLHQYFFGQVNSTVATVNGYPISFKEIRLRSTQNQAEVINYFIEKYKAEYDKDFWYKGFGGEIPIEVLRERCLRAAIKDNIQLILAKDNGFIKDIGYDAFLNELANENKRRKNAVLIKEPIYGPIEYTEEGYYSIRLSNIVEEKVKPKLAENEFKLTENEMKKMYEKSKDIKYKVPDEIKIEKIILDFSSEKDKSKTLADGKAYAEQIRSLYSNGAAFEELERKTYPGKISLKREEVVFDRIEKSHLYTIIKNMKVNDISEILTGSDQLYFVKCLVRNNRGYTEYNAIRDSIQSDYVNEKYDAMIQKLVDEANIVVNKKILNHLKT